MDVELAGRLPDFLILGEAKCGTTTLWQILSRDPRVFFPSEKELHFFSSDTDFAQHGRFETDGIDPYRRLFADVEDGQICGEATPNYLFDPGACARIRLAVPDARFLVILRDPVARAWSHYWHQVRRGREHLSFEDALDAEPGRLATGDPGHRSHFSYASRGRYIEGLMRFERHFSREQLCVVFLEDLRRDPAAVLSAVGAHLELGEVDSGRDAELAHANKANYPKWPRVDAATRWLRRWAEEKSPALARPIRALGSITRPMRAYSGRPRMPQSSRDRLRQAFAASDRELAAWLGRPVPWIGTREESGTTTPAA
jgi:Sulfotransferase family